MCAEHMTVSSRTSSADRLAGLSDTGRRKRAQVQDTLPTVEEAKRRLAEAAGRPQPWLTPEGRAVFADAATEDLGPKAYRSSDPE